MHAGDSPFNARGYPGRPFNEPLPDPHSPFGIIAPGRASSVDTFGIYSSNMGVPHWLGQTENTNQPGDNDPSTQYHAFNQPSVNLPRGAVGQGFIPEPMPRQPMGSEYGEMNGINGQFDRVLHGRSTTTNGVSINSANLAYNNAPFVSNHTSLGQSPSIPTSIPQSLPQFSDVQSSNGNLAPGMNTHQSQAKSLNEPPSPWANTDPLLMRPGNTDSPRGSTATPQNQPNQPTSHLQQQQVRGSQSSQPGSKRDQSVWLAASQTGVDDDWKEVPGPNSLTFSNVGQHNMMQEAEERSAQVVDGGHIATLDAQLSTEAVPTPEAPLEPEQSDPEPTPVAPDIQGSTPSKSRRKGAKDSQAQVVTTTKTTPLVSSSATSPATPSLPTAVPKAAWSTEDDAKKAKAGMSLREIQEDEARKAEARKAEKERERVARASAPVTPAAEEVFTMTAWGLPTSQVGSRTATSPSAATPTSANGATSPAPAPWSQPINVATAKKTMKEIQEEEEQRKKTAQKETVAAAATRRVYADTSTKPFTPTPTPSAGGVWTTVGPSGKTAAAAVGARPVPNTTTSSASIPTPAATAAARPNAPAPPRTVASTVAKGTPLAQKVDDFPAAPSADFLRWLGENLKGLNSSVNLEEISSMLLSFPLDPDSSTMELIAEMIYTNSTTLDGRRFASEFVNKRKADAATRKNGASAGQTSKVVSIADVVKTQPRPSQPEWGFKVVNKKKKGGRA